MKFFRPIVRRGPFDHRHMALANACDASSSSTPPHHHHHPFHSWGPPQPHTSPDSYDVDTQLFAIYFLVSETLATYLWFSIAAHCLQGTRIPFLTPTMRYTIGIFYAVLKMALLHYAFHSSLYFHITCVLTLSCLVLASIAMGWHRGPFWFLFYMKPPRLFQPFSLSWFCRHVVYLCMQGLSKSSSSPDTLLPTDPTDPAAVQLQLLHKFNVPLSIDMWNSTLIEHWRQSVMDYGDESYNRAPILDGSGVEARLLFAMQSNGLLVSFFLMTPSATLVHSLVQPNVSVFELVLRYHVHSSAMRSPSPQYQKTPLVYFASNPISSPSLSPAQKTAITNLLQRLNVNTAIGHDVRLRLLQCANFLSLPLVASHRRPSSATRRASALSSSLDSAFG
ncbi:Aste57867_12551 [Aphanomyces stellatus]|uniref:Aste57867_12551 protein n=1 Tax=Aphanomyces stellatus TaxID=120398 RepID=A0A485KVX4_9STRA|nr:hypothetical protein As57867_012505 [Aphanomyces stellatus]VFT89402.1 Aste57867_12551 [Aphanomyces stellatus]